MPQVETADFLRLTKAAGTLVCWDIETTGREADYASVLVISAKPYGRKPVSFVVEQVGNDRKVIREAREFLEKFDLWVTYYGMGFDVPFLNTRLLRHHQPPLAPKHHIDLYYKLKGKTLVGRRSMAHYAEFLRLRQKKMALAPDVWADAPVQPNVSLPALTRRCESDTQVLEALLEETSPLIREIKRG